MTRTLTAIAGNSQRLDGGSMFGNVPRALWERWITPDERHRIPLACRALLVRDVTTDGRERLTLLEAGIGAFFEPRLADRYGVQETDHVLLASLHEAGLSHEDIDMVVLSHLHFDHVGGLLTPWSEDAEPKLLFPNARFVVGEAAWERANAPHPRDRASFLPDLNRQLEDSGRLEIVAPGGPCPLGPDDRFHLSFGHTPGLLLTELAMPDGPVLFAGDLIPGRPWVHLPITMGYDRFPERLIDEKAELLADLVDRGGRLFYTHDPEVALSSVARDERGRFHATDPVPNPVELAA